MPARMASTAGRGVAARFGRLRRRDGVGSAAAGQVVQVLPFRVVELQGARHRLQHRLRRAGQIAALQPGVVVDADPGQHGDLLAPQTLHPPPVTMGGQPGLLGGEPGPAAGQEVPDVSAAVHGLDARTDPAGEPGPVSTRIAGSFQPACRGRLTGCITATAPVTADRRSSPLRPIRSTSKATAVPGWEGSFEPLCRHRGLCADHCLLFRQDRQGCPTQVLQVQRCPWPRPGVGAARRDVARGHPHPRYLPFTPEDHRNE